MHRPLLLALLLLAGCSTFRHGARKGELVLTKGKSAIYFAVPPEWVADQQAGEFGFHSLKPAGEWQPATISVAFTQRPFTRNPKNDDAAEQLALSKQYLKYWLTHDFPDTRLASDSTHATPSGRKFLLFRESSNGLHLVALAPEKDCVVEIGLHGSARDLDRYRAALLAVLDSYRVR
jgi:hypothetical protein